MQPIIIEKTASITQKHGKVTKRFAILENILKKCRNYFLNRLKSPIFAISNSNTKMNTTSSLLLTLIMILMPCAAMSQSSTFYCTRHNDFSQLRNNSTATVNGEFLQEGNETSKCLINLDTTTIDSYSSFKYYIKFANLHNREGKTYKVKDARGNTSNISSTHCGLVFYYNGFDYWSVSAHCTNSSLYNESVDVRSMTVELIHHLNGKDTIVGSTTLEHGVDLHDGYNYMGVAVEENAIKVLIGKDELKEIMSHEMSEQEQIACHGIAQTQVGYFVGPGAMISLERAVLAVSSQEVESSGHPITTQWTREALDSHFEASRNPFEGYWVYLDRDMEDTWLKLGGRYTIALIETSSGYDVIYVDGAQVRKSQWQLGMKKGEMTKTIFTDNFTGSWIDATFQPIEEDVFVTFESGVILTFKFPVFKSQIRFSKVLNQTNE